MTDAIDKQAFSALRQTLGDRIRQPITVFLGNPSATNQLYFDDEQTQVWINDNPENPNMVTAIPRAGIPPAKLVIGAGIQVVQTVNGYRYHNIDFDYDQQFSEGDSQQNDQKPVLLSQLNYGTIQPYSGMSVLVKGAFYGNDFVKDTVTGDIDDKTDTSSVAINIPLMNNRAIGVLIQLDPTVDPPVFSYKQSAQFVATTSLEQQYLAGNLPTPDADRYRVGYVMLYAGQTEINFGDIWQAPEWISPLPFIPSELDDYEGAPDEALNFVGYDTVDNTPYRLRGDYMRLWRGASVTVADRNLPSISMLWVVFDSATDRTFSLDSGTIVNGHGIRAQCKQVSGGTGHSILLPSGVTWDGTNRRVYLPTTAIRFEAIADSATRFLIWSDAGCTYAAS